MARKRKRYKNRDRQTPARRWAYIAIAAGVILLLAIVALAFLGGDKKNNSTQANAEEEIIALGKQVYEQNCAACHGAQGEGHVAMPEAPALDETEHAWHHPDGQIQELIVNGGQLMPAFGEQLDRDEVIAVVRYIQTWWTPGQLRAQQQRSRDFPFQ